MPDRVYIKILRTTIYLLVLYRPCKSHKIHNNMHKLMLRVDGLQYCSFGGMVWFYFNPI